VSRPGALALLRCIAVLGTERQRSAAEAAAAKLTARGVAEPAWTGVLGAERVTTAWGYGDVYGDQTSVLLGVERAGTEHGVVVLVDHTLDGIAKDAFLTPDPAGVLADIRGLAGPSVWVRELNSDEAAELLYPAFAASDAAVDPPVNEDFAAFRAVAAARVRLLGPERAPKPAAEVDQAERRAIVDEFLGSADGRALPAAARECAELLVDFGCEADRGRPLRASPAKIERFLADWLPAQPEQPIAVIDALPATLRAWARWAAERTELPPEAVEELTVGVDGLAEAYEHGAFDVVDEPAGDVVAAYLEGVDLDDLDPESLSELLHRRSFVMPFFGTRIGDDDYPHLDASDPDERALLIQGEHPEYHAALADPDSTTVEGVDPRLHLTVHEIVANQLWDDDPPEAWLAAERLLAAGEERHDILHAIGEVVARHLHGSLTGQGSFDLEAYLADLRRLGAVPGGSRT
jgi:hypothetical protein